MFPEFRPEKPKSPTHSPSLSLPGPPRPSASGQAPPFRHMHAEMCYRSNLHLQGVGRCLIVVVVVVVRRRGRRRCRTEDEAVAVENNAAAEAPTTAAVVVVIIVVVAVGIIVGVVCLAPK